VLGPNVAQVNITISQLAILGQRFVTATTDGRLVGGVAFTVTPSQAVVVSLSPNTAKQGNSVEATVTGENTNWSPATTFTLGSGIDVTNVGVIDSTHATLTLSVQALAAIGCTRPNRRSRRRNSATASPSAAASKSGHMRGVKYSSA